ncbi:MAG: hemin ABC transporter substrate-binding protein [Pararhodobacter sp.]
MPFAFSRCRLCAGLTAFALLASALPVAASERVVVVGGALAETVYALGQEHRLVGRDTTASHPPQVLDLPDVGYMRALSAEGLLRLAPDLILADEGAGPPETIALLRAAEVPFVSISEGYTTEDVLTRVAQVSAALDVEARGAVMVEELRTRFAEVEAARAGIEHPLRVMFILSAQGGRINAAGAGTAAAGIMALAGAENAVQGFQGYRLLGDEAITAAAPDAILMMDRDGDHAITDAQILAHPALGIAPAAQAGRIIRMNGLLLLGFGPRTPDAALALHRALYGS